MSADDWGGLTPSQISSWINFDRNDKDWQYERGESISMASKQAEGVAYLWNLLSQHSLALLADEVGMGKTFQALGVAAMLWKMKPDAKILVMAPNRDICAHWRREYASFINTHYRDIDHCVKNAADFGPVQSIKTLKNLEELASSIESAPAHFYLTTIHSLSGLIPNDEKDGEEVKKAGDAALKIHQRIKRALGHCGFDLIIIDEAHYFRNVDGGSQRVAAAKEFFGDQNNPLAQKALLLTATPSHTRMNDVESILSYFTDIKSESDRSVTSLMNKFGLRRFRLMEGKGAHYSKHQYRHEQAMSSGFKDRPKSEMFFALYQKKLVTELNFNRDNKKILYGFLEGFESVGRANKANEVLSSSDGSQVDEVAQGDYVKASDTMLLARLTGQYFEKFKEFPDHPKYSDLVEKCTPDSLFETIKDLHEDKHLVFVRRIPSVRELTQRINESYDAILAAKIYGAWGLCEHDDQVKKWRSQSWSRSGFDELVDSIKSTDDMDDRDHDEREDGHDVEENDNDAYLGSKISNLFVVIKGKNGRTDCSNVSLRFRRPRSIFSLFLEPSLDYKLKGYEHFYETSIGEVKRSTYEQFARDERLRKYNLEHRELPKGCTKVQMSEMNTVWSLIYPLLSHDHQAKLGVWTRNRPAIAENFSNYIKTGFLFASPVMVELYSWFTEFNRKFPIVDAHDKYVAFMGFVTPKIQGSLMLCYFKAALDTFEDLCEKITDHKLVEWGKEWRELKSLQNPAWYASGQSSNRQRLILGFNSPFYPNVMVATSVFQEGVNLHLQCRKVHHYGIAWTPGDNEQRVGRVDRLFGKVNNLLKANGKAELEINYPFLKNTFDEEQLASFIVRKSLAEEKMDACTQIASDRTVKLTQVAWQKLLRVPSTSVPQEDPYPAKFHGVSQPATSYVPYDNHHESDLLRHVESLLNEIVDTNRENIHSLGDGYPNAMLIVDPLVETEGQSRRQPILIERHFSNDFSALVSGTVYYITLKSPIASKATLGILNQELITRIEGLIQKLSIQYPLVKMAINPDLANSHFYLNVKVDLPIFVKRGKLGLLSKIEMEMAYNEVKFYSDRVEYELFGGERDLTIDNLDIPVINKIDNILRIGISEPIVGSLSGERWSTNRGLFGDAEGLAKIISLKTLQNLHLLTSLKDGAQPVLYKVLALNNHFPFLRFALINEEFSMSINYPSSDFSYDERTLLERWFDFVGKQCQ